MQSCGSGANPVERRSLPRDTIARQRGFNQKFIIPVMSGEKLIVIILIFFSDFAYSQSEEHNKLSEISLGFSDVKYSNSYIIPSGLPGKGYSIRYASFQNKLNCQSVFSIKLNHNQLISKEFNHLINNYPFHISELKLNIYRSRKIPTPVSNLLFFVGAGISLNGHFSYTKILENPHSTGYWNTSADIYTNLSKSIKSLNIQYQLRFPVITTGFFQEYQNSSFSYDFADNLKYYALPNFLTSFAKYTEIENNLSLLYTLRFNKRLKVKLNYEFTYLHANIHNAQIRKQVNELSLGLIILN